MPDDNDVNRRSFLKATAAGGLAGSAALAGCSGNNKNTSNGGGGSTTTSGNGGGGSTTTSGNGGGGKMGDKLPSYTYLNNPKNYNAARNEAINIIADQLGKMGLDVKAKVFEWGTLYNRVMKDQDYSFTTWNRGLGVDPGRRMPEMFYSGNTDPGEGNFTGYTNKDLDPTLQKQLKTKDVQKRIDMLFEIQKTINEDVPMHPIVQMPNIVAYNSDQVSGWIDHLVGYSHMQVQTAIEVDNDGKVLRGTWPETLGTMNVLGYNNETKLIDQFEMIYDKLVRINNDLKADPELSLATEWKQPDLKTVKYKIREGHKWHDGEDVTPEDVKFTLEYIRDKQVPLYSTQWKMYENGSVEVDGQWVTVNFSQEVGPVHTLFSNQFPIIPKHKWEGVDKPSKRDVSNPIGSGPLKFDYWDQGSELSLKKYDAHWHPVKYNQRIWRIIPEESTVWSLLKKGKLNYLPFSRIGKQLNDNKSASNVGVKSSPGDGWWHFSQNNRVKGLDDPKVRQANVWAIPKETISKQLLYGLAEPGYNLIAKSFGQFSNPNVEKYQGKNREQGKKVLKDAGYVFDDNGKVHFPAE